MRVQSTYLVFAALTLGACGSSNSGPAKAHLTASPSEQGSATALGNPYSGAVMIARQAYADQVEGSIQLRPDLAAAMGAIKQTSTALWLDSIARVQGLAPLLAEARQVSQQRQGQKAAVTIVVYDLPNRDCAANASNGELLVSQGGMAKYKGYIDQIAAIISAYPDVQIGAVIEPDSLGNIVTNLGRQKCAEAQDAYVSGIAYAVRTLQFANVALYLDSGHSGWLGWPNNRQGMANVVLRVLNQAGGPNLIRGFATNVSNYTPLVTTGNPPWYDPSNPAKDELTFVKLLAQDFQNVGIANHHFLIDTGRNGVINSRQSWGSWCNIQHAGIGQKPTVDPVDDVDAYVWVKPPGEADGTNQGADPRYDWMCSSGDAVTNVVAPQAGVWFEPYFESLVQNAP